LKVRNNCLSYRKIKAGGDTNFALLTSATLRSINCNRAQS
jgi:hypothetical protein